MSDVQPTNANGTAEASNDRTLAARRALVVVISFVLGFITVAAIMTFVFHIELDATFPISSVYFALLPIATLPLGLFFMIWIDYFFGTKIVVD